MTSPLSSSSSSSSAMTYSGSSSSSYSTRAPSSTPDVTTVSVSVPPPVPGLSSSSGPSKLTASINLIEEIQEQLNQLLADLREPTIEQALKSELNKGLSSAM